MSTSESAQIQLASPIASLELSVVASDFRTVASGIGRLEVAVPAGIYQVIARAGSVVERKLIQLDPGGAYTDGNVIVGVRAQAPVRQSTTSHEYQEQAAEYATQALSKLTGPPTGLVIIVRDERGFNGPPFEPADVAGFELRDSNLELVPGFADGWQVHAGEAVATWGGRIAEGGYALRTDPQRPGAADRSSNATQPFDLSLWLSPQWQTVVFVTTGPGGPRTSAATIHMAPIWGWWSPYETDVGLALELAIQGLRDGRSVVPDDLMSLLLNTKFVNPMLGIVGAHSLLLQASPDYKLLDIVLQNLDGLVPGHPDVRALRWLAARRSAESGIAATPPATPPAAVDGVSWPPTLLPSYRTLIDMDASDPNAIAGASVAERVASNLLVQGVWTTWTPLPPEPAPIASPDAQLASAAVLPALAADPAAIENISSDDPATARVAAYLTAVAALEGPDGRAARFATLTPQEIGAATTLPAATVERSLQAIGAAIPPVTPAASTGGGTLGGLGGGTIALIAAAVLLLTGAVGAVALCAGSDSCPVRIAVTEPTALPTTAAVVTALPTAEPTAPPTPTLPTSSPTPTPTLEPTPIIVDAPSQLDFGFAFVGGEPRVQPLSISGPEAVRLTFGFSQNPNDAYRFEECVDVPTESGASCTASVVFTPKVDGQHLGRLDLRVADQLDVQPVDLIGTGVSIRYPERHDFQNATVAIPSVPEQYTVFASEPLPFIQFDMVEDVSSAFSTDPTCEWVPREFGGFECTVNLTFNPPDSGQFIGALGIYIGESAPRRVELSGTGFFQIF